MPVINRIAALAPEMTAWRRHLHQHPELEFDCHETAAFVVARLRDFGVDEIHQGIATSGVVALIRGRAEGPVTRNSSASTCPPSSLYSDSTAMPSELASART